MICFHSCLCTIHEPSYLILFGMALAQIVTWVYKDSLILWYPPSIKIWLVLQFWYWLGRIFDTNINIVCWCLAITYTHLGPTFVMTNVGLVIDAWMNAWSIYNVDNDIEEPTRMVSRLEYHQYVYSWQIECFWVSLLRALQAYCSKFLVWLKNNKTQGTRSPGRLS